VDDGGFGGGVAECCVRAQAADADSGDGGGYYYPRGVGDRGAFLEEGREPGMLSVDASISYL
jgi:hypothetical protein